MPILPRQRAEGTELRAALGLFFCHAGKVTESRRAQQCHHPQRCSRNTWMWHSGMWFHSHGGVRSMVKDLRSLFHPKQFYGSARQEWRNSHVTLSPACGMPMELLSQALSKFQEALMAQLRALNCCHQTAFLMRILMTALLMRKGIGGGGCGVPSSVGNTKAEKLCGLGYFPRENQSSFQGREIQVSTTACFLSFI